MSYLGPIRAAGQPPAPVLNPNDPLVILAAVVQLLEQGGYRASVSPGNRPAAIHAAGLLLGTIDIEHPEDHQ